MISIDLKKQIIDDLIRTGAVNVNPLETNIRSIQSGIYAPIYIDVRRLLSDIDARRNVKNALVDLVMPFRFCAGISGVETGGVPYGIMVANELKMPFIAADENPLKPKNENDNSIVVIEDHVSTGSSARRAIIKLQKKGWKPVTLFCITSYGPLVAHTSSIINTESICCVGEIIEEMHVRGLINDALVNRINNFLNKPDCTCEKNTSIKI